ncbi:MAG: energy transducer TonB [Bdellovibrionota bacterium]
MKKILIFSAIGHLGFGLVLGLWICPWFERLTPDRRSVVDIDLMVISGGQATATMAAGREAAKSELQKRTKVPPKIADIKKENDQESPSKYPVSAVSAIAAKSAAETQADLLEINPEAATSLSLSVADYLRWVRDHNESPVYPRISRIRGEQGRAIVRVVVGQRGSPLEAVELEQSSGFELLDRVALEAAGRWHFPSFRGSQPRITILIPFKFALDVAE